MLLKDIKALKFFALLLFSLELLSPVFLLSSVQGHEENNSKISLHESSHSINILAVLICEEAGNEEERESKEHKSACAFWESSPIQFYYLPEKLTSFVEPIDSSNPDSSQPSLFILHSNYRI